MNNWQRVKETVVVLATLAAAAAFLVTTIAPSEAGLFSWLGGRQRNADPDQGSQQAPPFWSNHGAPWNRGGGGQEQSAAPSSGAFHGDELPPDEGNAATREWITNPALGLPTLSTKNIEPTKAAIQRYEQIVARGGWPTVPAYAMHPGSEGQEVVILHRRLEASGDLVGRSIPNEYDQALVQAVKKFQIRHELPPTGVIDRPTVDALNVPAAIRLRQLQVNLTRLQTLATAAASRYVVVNIPAAQVEAVEGGQVAARFAAVVGKPERASPELSSKIIEINFNPYWYVPRSIIFKDLVPKAREFARRGQDMLAVYHMEAFDPSGNPLNPRQIDWFGNEVYNYNFRQLPWEENSLGFVKINFPNKDAVYMHDTPLKSLFGRSDRFESSGCVRVHDVEHLVAWLLRGEPGWDIQHILAMKQSGEQLDVKLAKPVPVYFAYVTAWATPDGMINFRPDIYDHDGASTTASAY
jgi:murein L,D-transpeptidase YcbB/YkuD